MRNCVSATNEKAEKYDNAMQCNAMQCKQQ